MDEANRTIERDVHYDRGYHGKRHAALIADDEYFWARAEAQARLYFTDQDRSSRVFEYGCGIGQGIACLENGAGWDISSEAREACRARKLRMYDRIEDVPESAWDIVLCRHALEHMEEPLLALRRIRRLLAPAGHLLLVLPKERHQPAGLQPDLNQHLYTWNFRAINNLLYRAALQPTRNSYEYVLGYRRLLPIKRLFGQRVYESAARIVGRAYRNGELVIHARRIGETVDN